MIRESLYRTVEVCASVDELVEVHTCPRAQERCACAPLHNPQGPVYGPVLLHMQPDADPNTPSYLEQVW